MQSDRLRQAEPPKSSSAIILLTKTPGHAPIKTRLIPALGQQTAEALYRCFLQDIGLKFQQLNLPLRVYHLPGEPDECAELAALLGSVAGCWPQRGADLGARMQQAFVEGFTAGFDKLVLIGGDCPDLAPELFDAAFEALDESDCVLGPTRDGGYYLLGFCSQGFAPTVFDFSDWSARSVYAETLQKLDDSGTRYCELPLWQDVDTLEDLRQLQARNTNGWFAASATLRLLRDLT